MRRHILVLMAALMVGAILGIALTTLLNYDPTKHGGTQDVILILHILIAVGIIIGGIAQLVFCIRGRVLRAAATIGLLASLTAFATGGISADSGNGVAVFVMATCFIIALGAYGYGLTNLSSATSHGS